MPEASRAVAAGAGALRRSGPAAACLAVSRLELDAAVRRNLEEIARSLDGPAVVRSSTVQEADPRWAGAFASYLEVAAEDLAVAVRGCWASAFARDASARAEHLGVPPEDLRIAVLIQPWIPFDQGGTATLLRDGRVVVTAGSRGPAGIVDGSSAGTTAILLAEGGRAGLVPDPAGFEIPAAVAELLRDVARVTGDDEIEWGATGETVFLLQVRRAPPPPSVLAPRLPRRRVAPSPMVERLARWADRYPSPLGETLVLPWALAVEEALEVPAIATTDAPAAWAEILRLAAELSGQAWDVPPSVAAREAAVAFRAVLGGAGSEGLERLGSLRSIDEERGARLLGLLGGLGNRLVTGGLLGHPDLIWRLSPDEVGSALGAHPSRAPGRLGPDRWEPFVFGVVEAAGRPRQGTPAAPGIGAGRLLVVTGPDDLEWVGPRRLLVMPDPVPQAGPLLWGAAGVVTDGGSQGAHLFEIARSLGVPAVTGLDLIGEVSGTFVAVDGDSGLVSVWTPESCGRRRPPEAVARRTVAG